jgi:hypothetical protein
VLCLRKALISHGVSRTLIFCLLSDQALDPLVSRGAVNDNEMPEEFYIFDSNIIEDLNKLHNDNTANLNETFLYRVNDDSTEEAAPSLLHSRCALSSQSSNLSWCIQDSDFLSFI